MTAAQRSVLEDVLAEARTISKLDRPEHIAHPADAYAYALGRANGMGFDIAIKLEVLLGRKANV